MLFKKGGSGGLGWVGLGVAVQAHAPVAQAYLHHSFTSRMHARPAALLCMYCSSPATHVLHFWRCSVHAHQSRRGVAVITLQRPGASARAPHTPSYGVPPGPQHNTHYILILSCVGDANLCSTYVHAVCVATPDSMAALSATRRHSGDVARGGGVDRPARASPSTFLAHSHQYGASQGHWLIHECV